MLCWKCSKEISDHPVKPSFRETCPHCEIDLHVCVNCRFYSPGKPNECRVPGTEYISDREAANYCEEFALKTDTNETPGSTEKAKRLFGIDETEKKPNFDSLFKEKP